MLLKEPRTKGAEEVSVVVTTMSIRGISTQTVSQTQSRGISLHVIGPQQGEKSFLASRQSGQLQGGKEFKTRDASRRENSWRWAGEALGKREGSGRGKCIRAAQRVGPQRVPEAS